MTACSFSGSGSSASLDGGIDAPEADAAPEPVNCGGSAVYVDGFDGPDSASHWNLFLAADLTFNGRLIIDPSSNSAPSGVTSGQLIDVSDDRVTVEVPTHFEAGSGRQASFVLARAADRFFGFHMSGDELTVELADSGSSPVFMVIPLDRSAHRHLSLREEGGAIVWETSKDGVEWMMVAKTESPDYVKAVRVQILAIEGGGSNEPIQFDGLNSGRDVEPWCDASAFVDTFDDGSIDPRWLALAADGLCGSIIERTNIAINVIAGTASADVCSLRSAPSFRLTGNSATLQVGPIADTEVERFLNIHAEDGAFFGLSHSVNGLCSYSFDALAQEDALFGNCIAFTPDLLFWRARSAGADVVIEASADAVTWQNIVTQPAPFPLDVVDVEFGTFMISGPINPATMVVRGFNPQ